MPRYRLTLAYDGTEFAGWQIQSTRVQAPTLQGTLEAALLQVNRQQAVRVQAASRTDTGVHALGQVVAFELAEAWDAERLERALNALLPPALRVVAARTAAPDFHPRRDARSKLYRYTLDTGPIRWPARRHFAAYSPIALDERRVLECAAFYLGRHDFASLASAGGSVKTTVRTVRRSDVDFQDLLPRTRTLIYEVEADGFLRKMVRSLVGGLMAVGSGRLTIANLRRALEARNRSAWPAPAAACGLCLVRVDYPGEGIDAEDAPVTPN
ncbi:MAG: tRNA pseudouridine(38-40) synthase TruA [Vicinamibacteria bacterium]|nr:tRNA pseudouridine(38-40) synthase TruA [Vicinamibacteria bacterium]